LISLPSLSPRYNSGEALRALLMKAMRLPSWLRLKSDVPVREETSGFEAPLV
jgi:hypothetical protein